MGLKIDRVQLEIVVQQNTANQRLLELEDKMKNVRSQMNSLSKQRKKDTDEYRQLEQQLKQLKQEYENVFDTIDVGKMTMMQLANRQRELNAVLRNMDPSLPEWKKYNDMLKQVTERIRVLRGQARDTGLSLSKLADGFNKYGAMAAGAIASVTGLMLTARGCVDEFAQMEEAESQVIKYTGMTKDEVKELNEEFKQMDTRTPRDKLNALAGDAGRLGITGKKGVNEFVDAANQINVALGEDLGEDAVANIGKLAMMFGEDKEKGLRGAMLATGSAVNEVAQNSSAAERFLVDFAARVAGVAHQANISQADIIGFAASMDENMLRNETSATAYQNILMKMFTDTEKFAEVAGLNLQEFSKLVRTDANEAMLTFAKSLSKKGGMADLAPIFGDLKTEGAGVASVLSVMAGKADEVRSRQHLANEAYREATSLTKEYNVQNNTVQAGLDKAKEQFRNVRIELGEQLLPVMSHLVSTASLTVKGLSLLISIVLQYKTTILTAAAGVAAYTAAVKGATAADKLKVFWTNTLVGSVKTLYATVSKHPWAVVAAAGATLIAFLVDLKKKQNEVTESMKAVKRVQDTVSEEFNKQASRIKLLTDIVNNNNLANKTRTKALNELKSIIPGYNAMINEEGRLINNNKEAIQDYLIQLEKEVRMKAAQDELENLYRQKRAEEKSLKDAEIEQSKARVALANAELSATLNAQRASTAGTKMLMANLSQSVKTMQTELAKADAAVEKSKDKLMGIDNALKAISKELNESQDSVISSQTAGGTGGSGGTPKPDADPYKTASDKLQLQYQDRLNTIKMGLLTEKTTQEQYQSELYKAEMNWLLSRKALMEQYGKDTSAIQGQIYDKMIAESNRLYKQAQQMEADNKAAQLGMLDEEYAENQAAIKQRYLDGELATEQDYKEALLELERDYLEQKRDMLQAYGEDTTDIDNQLLDKDVKQHTDNRKSQRDSMQKQIDETDDFDEKNRILQAMYDADLITYEQYLDKKRELDDDYGNDWIGKWSAGFNAASNIASTFNDLMSALQDREIKKIERKYDKQIKAAKKAGKDTTQLEEEKEAAVMAIKKKYADKQFALNVMQIIADTAKAIMVSWATLGPILGPIYAALAAAQGATQVVIAKTQRDEAKGLKTGGYSAEYIEGFTATGNPDDTAGVIPVHKNEFVANHEAVANPAVRQFLDVFDMAQKNGSIRMINTTQILEHVRTRSGKYAGGYTDGDSQPASAMSVGTPENRLQTVQLLQDIKYLLQVISEKEVVVDPRKVRDSIRRIEQLERNVSR